MDARKVASRSAGVFTSIQRISVKSTPSSLRSGSSRSIGLIVEHHEARGGPLHSSGFREAAMTADLTRSTRIWDSQARRLQTRKCACGVTKPPGLDEKSPALEPGLLDFGV